MRSIQFMLQQPLIAVRFADLLDIGVIAVLLYLGLVWLRQRGSRSLAVVLGALIFLQLTADRLNMVVTSTLFHLGFTAVLLALIVIFQHDIRRALERLAAWSVKRRGRPVDAEVSEMDVLSECIAVLADKRIGALFVFRGSEPLEPHLRGGVAVDGHISLPLLYSIFHPASPGHDGAVVSEERGTITIAENGRLQQIQPAQLRPMVQRRHPHQSPTPQHPYWSWLT